MNFRTRLLVEKMSFDAEGSHHENCDASFSKDSMSSITVSVLIEDETL